MEAPIAVVTGTSRGIGAAIARRLIADGFVVFGCSRGQSDWQDEAYHHSKLDIAEASQVQDWFREIREIRGRVDVAICNAAITDSSPALLTSAARLEEVMRVNFFGTVSVCKAAAELMIPRHFGRIVALSSIAVVMDDVGTSSYVASKCAVEGYVKVLAKELAGAGITCNAIRISAVNSEMTKDLSDEIRSRVMDRVVTGRFASMDDVCNVVSFLVRPESEYLSGCVLPLGFSG